MTRPRDDADALEAELAALQPAAPSADLRRRVGTALTAEAHVRPTPAETRAIPPALAEAQAVRPARGRWLAERLLWACGGAAAGAVAASLAFAPRPASAVVPGPAAPGPTAIAVAEPFVDVSEESVAWADAGVQFLDDRTPARILRRVAVERHRPAGGGEYRVPREDVILLPVALR